MDKTEMKQALDDAYDMALLHHGFTGYLRDYEMVIQFSGDPRSGFTPEVKRYLFTHCVSASIVTALSPATWSESLDERLIDRVLSDDLNGYIWAAGWQSLFPGGFELEDVSEPASSWQTSLGIPFYEVHMEGNGHDIRLVFSDLRVESVEPGYAPFVLGNPFWDGKIPL